MSAKAVEQWPCGMAAREKKAEAPEDVARGLENLPVSAWPPGAWPKPFQVGGGAQPARDLHAAPGGGAGTSLYGAGLGGHERCARSLRAQAGALPGRGRG